MVVHIYCPAKKKKKGKIKIAIFVIDHTEFHIRVYPKVSGLAVWRESCKLYSSLPLGALFCESV